MAGRPYIPRPSRVSPFLWPFYAARALLLVASVAAAGTGFPALLFLALGG